MEIDETLRIIMRKRRRRREERNRERFFEFVKRRNSSFLLLTAMVFTLFPAGELRFPRLVWAEARSLDWWNTIVMRTWDDVNYLKNFRMTKGTFNYILQEIGHRIERMDTKFRQAIRPEHRLAITLWRLATNAELRTLSHTFGVGVSTVCTIVLQTSKVINSVFRDKVIKLPCGQRLDDCLDMTAESFPQAVGAIDGSYIKIRAPSNNPRDYFNRKSCYSVVLQAVVDNFGLFIDVNVGWPGSVHDARVFTNSNLYGRLEANTTFPADKSQNIRGTEVPVLLLGDSAYPLLPNVMKPFSVPRQGGLTRDQETFNTRLSNRRIVVEHAFARLKGRWRMIAKTVDNRLENIPKLVLTCCILHNIVEMRRNPYYDHWTVDEDIPAIPAHQGPNAQNVNNDNGANNGAQAANNVANDDEDDGNDEQVPPRASAIRDALVLHFAR